MQTDTALPPLPEGRITRAAIRARLRLIDDLARASRQQARAA